MNRRRQASIVAANLLAPLGVLAFGWNAAAAVFLVWLDTLLVSLQLGALALAAGIRGLPAPAGTHRGGWWIGIGLGMLFVAPLFFAPPLLLGMELHDALRPQFPAGPLAAAFADRGVYLWIALEVLVRGWQVCLRWREVADPAFALDAFAPRAADQLLGLVFRTVVLIHLAWLAAWLGRPGLIVFLVAAGAFLAYAESHEDWVRRLLQRLQQPASP
jgi:hypothetical protein